MSSGLDARLCALLDGELAPAEAAQLRAEIAQRPELAARLAELAAVDEELRALPGPPVQAELRARLERRIRAEGEPGIAPLRGARRSPPRSRRRWLAAAALAAAAAALAWVVLPQLRRDDAQLARVEPPPEPAQQALEPAPPVEPEAPSPIPGPKPRVEIAEQRSAPPAPAQPPEPALTDVAIAEDLPVIEVLDVLAELDELEEVGSG